MMATNFEEYIFKMAEEAPHAVVLDWYRRLELMVRSYLETRAIHWRSAYAAESVIAHDALLGNNVAAAMSNVRTVRNSVAHTEDQVSFDTAIAFARDCFSLIGVLLQAQDANVASPSARNATPPGGVEAEKAASAEGIATMQLRPQTAGTDLQAGDDAAAT